MTSVRSKIFLFSFVFAMLGRPFIGYSITPDGYGRWRKLELVSISGAQLPFLLGTSIGSMRLLQYRASSGTWSPVPFQTDERDGGESFLAEGNGILDSNDEIVFMAADAGDPADSTVWPEHTPGIDQDRYRITLIDSVAGEEAGEFTLYTDPALPVSDAVYIDYYAAEDRVETDLYMLRHGSSGFQEDLFLKASAGGDSIDFLDRQKLRLKLTLDLGVLGHKDVVVKEQMDEDIDIIPGLLKAHIRSRKKDVEAVTGSVRVIRYLTLEVTFSASFLNDIVYKLPFTTVCTAAYTAWLTGEMAVPEIREDDFTADMKEMRLSTDWSPEAIGLRFFSRENTETIRIDGIPDTPVTDLSWPGKSWHAVIADPDYEGTLASASVFTATRLGGYPPGDFQRLYYKDFFWPDFDDTGDSRSYGDTGIFVSGSRITGTVDFTSRSYFFPENLSSVQMDSLFIAYMHPLKAGIEEQKLKYARISLETDPSGLAVIVDSTAWTTPCGFDWIRGSLHSLDCDSIQGDPESTRFRFDGWSNDRPLRQTYTVPGSEETLTARFITQHRLDAAGEPPSSGSVMVSPPEVWHDEGTRIGLEAIPAQWYGFFEWSGDLTGIRNPDSLWMDAPKRVVAHFGNWAPLVEAPDTTFAEDTSLSLPFGQILDWTFDRNNPDSTLSVEVEGGPYLSIVTDDEEEIVHISTAQMDWNGSEMLVIRAIDPLEAVGADTVEVFVLAVPDPPGPFSLLHPDSNMVFESWPDSIVFAWEEAVDPDSGETVFYSLQIDTTYRFDSPALIRIDSLETALYDLEWPDAYGDAAYAWRVEAVDETGLSRYADAIRYLTLATGAEETEEGSIPHNLVLDPVYPNPFNGPTTIRFGVPRAVQLTIRIYDSLGRRVCSLQGGRIEAGVHTLIWDGTDGAGQMMSSGIYFIVLHTEKIRLVRKALLVR